MSLVQSKTKRKRKKEPILETLSVWLQWKWAKTMGVVSEEAIDEFLELIDQGLTFYLFPFLLLLVITKLGNNLYQLRSHWRKHLRYVVFLSLSLKMGQPPFNRF